MQAVARGFVARKRRERVAAATTLQVIVSAVVRGVQARRRCEAYRESIVALQVAVAGRAGLFFFVSPSSCCVEPRVGVIGGVVGGSGSMLVILSLRPCLFFEHALPSPTDRPAVFVVFIHPPMPASRASKEKKVETSSNGVSALRGPLLSGCALVACRVICRGLFARRGGWASPRVSRDVQANYRLRLQRRQEKLKGGGGAEGAYSPIAFSNAMTTGASLSLSLSTYQTVVAALSWFYFILPALSF